MTYRESFPITEGGEPIDVAELQPWTVARPPTDLTPVELPRDQATFKRYMRSMIEVTARRPGMLLQNAVSMEGTWDAYQDPDTARFGVVNEDGVVIGSAGIGFDKEDRGLVWLFGVFTLPEYEHQGIARRLVAAALTYALEHGAQCATLGVYDENERARAIYDAAGFDSSEVVQTLFNQRDGVTAMFLACPGDIELAIQKLGGNA